MLHKFTKVLNLAIFVFVYTLYIHTGFKREITMSIDNWIYGLSNINAALGSVMGYVDNKQAGMPTGYALANAGSSLSNGIFRNEMSRQILNHTGSYLGYAVNGAAGYGNPISDYYGTRGTFGAAMLMAPWNFCNPYMMTSSLYGGFWGGSYFGGCGCNNYFGYGLGMPSMFGPCGFYC